MMGPSESERGSRSFLIHCPIRTSDNPEVPDRMQGMRYDSSAKVRHGSLTVRPCSWRGVLEVKLGPSGSDAAKYWILSS